MIKTILLFCFVAVAVADQGAKIANYQFGIQEDGSFDSKYQTTNGISASEEGISYPGAVPGTGNYVMQGYYEYEWEGVTYKVTWKADESGFHPVGKHLHDYSHNLLHIPAHPEQYEYDN